ncbi:hypothetical protein ABW19_dt0206688 [Dactylella cylindrospora]|nr:hypothetical protein ABW19_dt0206688 [Dactylella cylindrospora]
MKILKSFFKSSAPAAQPTPGGSADPFYDARGIEVQSNLTSTRSGIRASILNWLPKGEFAFTLEVDPRMWPALEIGDGSGDLLASRRKIILDSTGRFANHWAAGANVHNYFCKPLFPAISHEGLDASQLPPLLFDLGTNRVVRSSDLAKANYAVVSHVWGATVDIEGLKYGVNWKIPIRDEQKLKQILETARLIIGERYIWMDVLCMDQRKKNKSEIANMKNYLAHATGCLVWLENTYNDPDWKSVLNAIKKVNRFFELDQYANALPGAMEARSRTKNITLRLSVSDKDVFDRIKDLRELEAASWFKRVWTLQEGVIPENVFFCTPERYITAGCYIWTISELCESLARRFLRIGRLEGTAIANKLQLSEIHKMLHLRNLYQKREISYWHLTQAVRTRNCKYEQDRVFGVCGMIRGTIPVINYDRSIEGLYEDLYRTYIDDGDFLPCQFLGGRSLLPDPAVSMGYIRLSPAGRNETHSLVLTRGGLRMDNVGFDRVTIRHCVGGFSPEMVEWAKLFPDFASLDDDAHVDLARAFELNTTLYKDTELCPGSFAPLIARTLDQAEQALLYFKRPFRDLVRNQIPMAILQWVRVLYLTQNRKDSALMMIRTESSEVQLAVFTERSEGTLLAVMPSSYKDNPGPGCLMCEALPNGNLRKVGVGLGRLNKASELGTFLLVN